MKQTVTVFFVSLLLSPTVLMAEEDGFDCAGYRQWAEKGEYERNKIDNNTAVAVGLDTCLFAEKIQCIDTADVFINSYNNAIGMFNGEGKKDLPLLIGAEKNVSDFNLSIEDNFKALIVLHKKALDEIHMYMSSSLNNIGMPQSLDQLKQRYFKLDESLQKARDKLKATAAEDNKFLYQMELNAVALQDSLGKSGVVLANTSCDKEVKAKLTEAIHHAEEVIFQLSKIKAYINVAKQKRTILLDKIHQALIAVSQERYAQFLGASLDDIIKDLSVAFELEKVSYEIGSWWLDANRNGLANRLHTMYLQYDEPLHILQAHLGQISIFREKLKKFSGAASEARDALLKGLDDKKALIETNIDEIVRTGWRGYLDRQMALVNMFKLSLDAYQESCRQIVEKYDQVAQATQSHDQFFKAEILFKQIIDDCKKK